MKGVTWAEISLPPPEFFTACPRETPLGVPRAQRLCSNMGRMNWRHSVAAPQSLPSNLTLTYGRLSVMAY
jgi:hypothetical protein